MFILSVCPSISPGHARGLLYFDTIFPVQVQVYDSVILRNGQNDVYLCGRQTHGLVELLVAKVKILEFLTKLSVIG